MELVPPGWTKMQYQNPAEVFLSAYFQATQANQQRRALEERAQALTLENKRIELDRELGHDRLKYQTESAERRAETAEGVLRVRQATEERMGETFNQKVKQALNTTDQVAELSRELNQIDAPAGSEKWDSEAGMITTDPKYADVIGSTAAKSVIANARNFHKDSVQARRSELGNLSKGFDADVRKTTGYKTFQPNMWGTDSKTGQKYLVIDAKTGSPLPPNTPKSKDVRYRHISPEEHKSLSERQERISDSLQGEDAIDTTTNVATPKPTTRVIKMNGHSYEVDDSSRQVLRQID